MHAAAIPDADPTTLKRPEQSAREFADAIADALPRAVVGSTEPIAVATGQSSNSRAADLRS